MHFLFFAKNIDIFELKSRPFFSLAILPASFTNNFIACFISRIFSMKKLSLVDGSGFLFRAWYAFPPMINAQGQNQNVIYGSIRMMLKLLFEQPEYFVICWDSPVKTKRKEKYEAYKANRTKLEDEFKAQIPLVMELVSELGIPTVTAPGYEADDSIGTLATLHQQNPDLLIQVFSSDKDLKQLLAPNLIVTDPLKHITTRIPDFEKEFGFAPVSIVDYLALIGDAADNVKGVAGIGPKKASDLIKKYGTIEQIYTHLDEIQGEIKEKLINWKEDAFFSKELILLMQVPELQAYPLEKMRLTIDFAKWEEILVQKRGFKNLQKILQEEKKKTEQPQQLGLF